jgi:hypothetical protein
MLKPLRLLTCMWDEPALARLPTGQTLITALLVSTSQFCPMTNDTAHQHPDRLGYMARAAESLMSNGFSGRSTAEPEVTYPREDIPLSDIPDPPAHPCLIEGSEVLNPLDLETVVVEPDQEESLNWLRNQYKSRDDERHWWSNDARYPSTYKQEGWPNSETYQNLFVFIEHLDKVTRDCTTVRFHGDPFDRATFDKMKTTCELDKTISGMDEGYSGAMNAASSLLYKLDNHHRFVTQAEMTALVADRSANDNKDLASLDEGISNGLRAASLDSSGSGTRRCGLLCY